VNSDHNNNPFILIEKLGDRISLNGDGNGIVPADVVIFKPPSFTETMGLKDASIYEGRTQRFGHGGKIKKTYRKGRKINRKGKKGRKTIRRRKL
jgi:hypothetical protein